MRTAPIRIVLAVLFVPVGCKSPASEGTPVPSASAIASAAPGNAVVACGRRGVVPGTAAELEKLANQGDACAMATLGQSTLHAADLPDDFARAARWLTRAADAGADNVDCSVFELGIGMPVELTRAADCYEREGDWRHLAILHLNGWGVPRSPVKADSFLTRARGWEEDCTGTTIAAAVTKAKGEPAAPYTTWRWCEDIACTTLDSVPCQATANIVARFRGSESRKRALDALGPAALAEYDGLRTAFRTLEEVDSRDAYNRHIDGTMRNAMALRREQLLQEHFDKLLTSLGSGPALPTVSSHELVKLRSAAADVHTQLTPTDKGMNFDPMEQRGLRAKVDAAWGEYVRAWQRFGRTTKNNPSATAMEAVLLRDRTAMFEDEMP